MCFFVLTLYAFNISLFAEDTTASREQPVVNEQPVVSESDSDDKNSIVDTSDTFEDEDVDFADISMDATFVKDSLPSYNRAVFTFNDKLFYYFFRPLSKG